MLFRSELLVENIHMPNMTLMFDMVALLVNNSFSAHLQKLQSVCQGMTVLELGSNKATLIAFEGEKGFFFVDDSNTRSGPLRMNISLLDFLRSLSLQKIHGLCDDKSPFNFCSQFSCSYIEVS